MKEKVLVSSQRYQFGKALVIFTGIVALICILIYSSEYNGYKTEFETCTIQEYSWDVPCCEATTPEDRCDWHDGSWMIDANTYAAAYSEETLLIVFCVAAGVGLICFLIFMWMRSYEIIVTDKRVYGCAAFGKRVDLPMDSVSAVGTMFLKGISVATSSGRIAFLMIKNRDEIHETISKLLIERQHKVHTASVTNSTQTTVPAPSVSNAEELKKYKELLDMEVITQEEFDAKKKQLLGL